MGKEAVGSVFTKARSYITRKTAELKIVANNVGIPHQKTKLRRFIENDEFIFVLFDACRYDYFSEMYSDYFTGELTKVYNTNTYTKQYQQATWTESYDITYVAGGPVITDRNFELSDLDYRPSEHFEEIVDVWDMGYEKELGVTPPEAVTEIALECDAPRLVVHYFQPHAPYIGAERLRDNTPEVETEENKTIVKRKESLLDIYDRIESGQVSTDRLRAVYRSNLERVMDAARPLVAGTYKPTVITSDHGELLGEDGRYLHGGFPHRTLCELPWFEVDEITGEPSEVDPEKTDSPAVEKQVKDQLRDLGYV